MSQILGMAGIVVVALGAVFLLLAAWGVHILPDALSRQHAATMAGSIALTLICLGVALITANWQWVWKLAVIVVFLFLTLPLGSHMVARAAALQLKHNATNKDK